MLICGTVAENAATKNIAIIEVLATIRVRTLPATLPPMTCVFILVGGQPSRVYATKIRIRDPHDRVILDKPFIDVPFTTQIKRANLWAPLTHFSDATDIIKETGQYHVDLMIEGEPIGTADLEVLQAPGGTAS